MTILSVAQEVCKVIGLDVPDSLLSSTEREYVELVGVANTMADRIAKGHDWQLFSTIATITGDGTTEDWDLPTDYDRMLVKSQVWSSSLETPITPIGSLDFWLEIDIKSFDFVINAWILYGGQIHIKPALADTVTAKYFYQSNLIIHPSSGSNVSTFIADESTFRLSEELLKLGMIWQWRANKGLPYEEDMANYEQLLARLVSKDKGSRMLRVGKVRMPMDTTTAYPQAVGV